MRDSEEPVEPEEPSVTATFKSKLQMEDIVPFGIVKIQVKNIPNADQYEVDFKLANDVDHTTPRTKLDTPEAKLPLIRYTEKITVRIYDSGGNLLHTFNDVNLVK